MDKIFAAIIGFSILACIVILISLFFIKLGWSLFMVPMFNLPELTWMQALGLSFLAGAFKSYNYKTKD